jgi:hypothetical protein
MTFPRLMLPQISLNGTSKRELVDQQLAVAGALRLVLEAMSAAAPNGRDYQHRPGEYSASRAAWVARQAAIVELRRDIEKYAADIDDLT